MDAEWFQTFGYRTFPAVGRVALLQYEDVSHVAVVTGVDGSGFTVEEANYKRCKQTTRFIKWNSPEVVGFLDLGPSQRKSLAGAEPQSQDVPNILDTRTVALVRP